MFGLWNNSNEGVGICGKLFQGLSENDVIFFCFSCLGRVDVESKDLMASPDQVGSHGETHVSKPYEAHLGKRAQILSDKPHFKF
jgi:hypothetical protein